MERIRLRPLAAIALIAGGLSFLSWTGLGALPSSVSTLLADVLLSASYVATVLGLGALSRLARETDDATWTGVAPLTVGLALLAPLLVGATLGIGWYPPLALLMGVVVAGLAAFLFGFSVLASVLYFTESTLVPRPWGRVAALLGTAGVLGWIVSVAFGQPDPPQAFRIVNPYTAPLQPPTLLLVLAGFGALGVALCLIGGGLLRVQHDHPGRLDRTPT